MDRWVNLPIRCKGGLRLDLEKLTQGADFPGTAVRLQNYECSLDGGYRRINGYSKYDSMPVPGSGPVLGVKPAIGGVFAIRKNGTNNALYKSLGAGWSGALNTTARTGTPTKARIFAYNLYAPSIVITDGVNPAGKYSGSTYTHLNGTGAPAAPKYADTFRQRLVLAPGSSSSTVVLSSPTDDTDFNGINGAIELNTGDTVKGIKTFRDALYIFCENSIWKLEGFTEQDFIVSTVSKNIGCLSHDSIQEIGGDLIYLSQSGLRSLAGTVRFEDLELGVVSRGIQSELKQYLNLGEDAFSSIVVASKSQYRLFIYRSSVLKTNTIGFIGTLTDTPIDPKGQYEWSTTKGIQAYSAGARFDDDNEVVVMGDASNGFVYSLESGSSFDGDDIEATFKTPYITFTNPSKRKVFYKIRVYTQVEGDVDITLRLLLDNENIDVLQPPAIQITDTGGFSVYGTATYDASTYSIAMYPIYEHNLVGSGITAALQFTGTNANPPHRIDSLDNLFAEKGYR